MTEPKYVHHREDGGTILCYGEPRDDSNFEIVCDNEEYDGIWADSIPTRSTEAAWRGDGMNWETTRSWKRICNFLLRHYRKDIEQITTC